MYFANPQLLGTFSVNKFISKLTMVWLASLSMLNYLVTDMYLPAFDAIRIDMDTTKSAIGLSLTVFLAGMAIGQMIYGPLSDRYGRKPSLLLGLSILVVSTIVISVADSIEMFLAARFAQAIGACSASVIWQAIVVDRYDRHDAKKIFALLMPLVALSPAIAPLVGAAIQANWGWRFIFYTIIAIGVVLMLITLSEEESYVKRQQDVKNSRAIISNYREIIISSKFVGNMLISSAASASFFAWVTGSPFVMTAMGYTPSEIGVWYIPQTVAFIVGGYTCKSLLGKYSDSNILKVSIAASVTSITAMAIYSYLHESETIIPYVMGFCLLAAGNGAMYPLVISKALEDFKHCSATSAGLFNFIQTLFCFASSAYVSAFVASGMVAISTAMLATLVIFIIGIRLTLADAPKRGLQVST